MKKMPVIMGGSPAFRETLGIVRPVLPALSAISDRLANSMATGQLTNNGQYVRQLEFELAEYLGVKHAVAVGNATIGLIILMKALGRTGEVIMPSFTYSATAHAAVWAGQQPVFADILPDTYTIDPSAVEKLINERTVAIMGVHIYGHACEIEELQSVADRHGIPLIFDAAHAFGSYYRGTRIGSFGFAEVFSFHATKIFPVGEGGVVTTEDDELANTLHLLRAFGGLQGEENTVLPGTNGKMQEFNALIGLENLKVIDDHVQTRRSISGHIQEMLEDVPGLTFQTQKPYAVSNYQNLSVLVDESSFGLNRDELYDSLKLEGIGSRKYFFPALHEHDTYRHRPETTPIPLPVTERVSSQILCLPIYSQMTLDEAEQMCSAICNIHNHASSIRTRFRTP